MFLIDFKPEPGKLITQYGSRGVVIESLAKFNGVSQVACIQIETGGVLGYHQAQIDQLLLVISGEGEIRSLSGDTTPIQTGQGVIFLQGEPHEIRTTRGLTALLIEGFELACTS